MSERLTARQRVYKREQYRKWINRSVLFGVTGLLLAFVAQYLVDDLVLFAGLGVYWLGCLGMAILYWNSPVSIRDELEQRMVHEASLTTYTVVVAVVAIGLPVDVVLTSTGVYTFPATFRGVVWGYFLLIMVHSAAVWLVRRQYE